MQSSGIVLMVMFGFGGLILWLVGYSIKKNQNIEDIKLPGLNIRDIKDRKGFAHFIGNGLQTMGIVSLLIGGSLILLPVIRMFVLLMFLITLIATCLRMILGIKKFKS